MISNTLLKIASGALLLVIAGATIVEIINQRSVTTVPIESQNAGGVFAETTSGVPNEGDSHLTASEVETGNAAQSLQPTERGGRLTIGVMGATPKQNEIVTISEIPWLTSQVNSIFREAANTTCTLLLPDLPLEPALAGSNVGSRRSLGRIPAFTVGLEVSESGKKKLPVATRSAIHTYLKEHRLAIEPTVYESEEGKPYFGTDCRAALYQLSSPTRTVKAEPMIEVAIGQFRTLGVLGGDLANSGRTLLMGFRYVKASDRITSTKSNRETTTELLFLHLNADATTHRLRFKAFITTNERQTLHELSINDSVLREPVATIVAEIRFDSFSMMGVYPADPVVTGMRHQASGALPVTAIRLLTADNVGHDKLTFEDVLDQFGELSRRTDLR